VGCETFGTVTDDDLGDLWRAASPDDGQPLAADLLLLTPADLESDR
jgi:hypothetical protein